MSGIPVPRLQAVLLPLVVAAVTALSIGLRFSDWYGSWGETARTLEDATLLTYPLVAGVSAWWASSPRRRRYQWILASASRSPLQVFGSVALFAATLSMVGALVTAAGAYVVTGNEADFGSPAVLPLLTISCGFAAAAAFGGALGAWLPPMVAPIGSVVLVYAATVFADTGNPSLAPLAGLVVSDPRERTYNVTESWMLGTRAVWLLFVAMLFVAVAAKLRSGWLVPFGLVCLTAVPLLLVGDGGMTADAAATRPVCHQDGRTATVCLTAGRNHAYEEARAALDPELRLLNGLQGKAWALTEETISSTPNTSFVEGHLNVPFGLVDGYNGNAHRVDRKSLQAAVSTTILQGNCEASPPTADGVPAARPGDVVQRWVLEELGIPVDGSEGFTLPNFSDSVVNFRPVMSFDQWWRAATETERTEWFADHRKALVDCTIKASETGH